MDFRMDGVFYEETYENGRICLILRHWYVRYIAV